MSSMPSDEGIAEIIVKVIEEKNPETVHQLSNLVKEEVSLSEKKILNQVLRLQREGRIVLKEPSHKVPRNLSSYLKTRSPVGIG